MHDADHRPSNQEQTLAAAVGLQTIALDALVRELRAAREDRVHVLWHTAIGAVVAVSMFAGLWLLTPAGLVSR